MSKTATKVGDNVGGYTLIERVASGGMGVVYAAEHVSRKQKVAIKMLQPKFSRNPQLLSRFVNEAKVTASLCSPGLVDVFEIGELADGGAYIVMEFLEGEDLMHRLKRDGSLSFSLACSIAIQIADALEVAHEKGIIHRDLKPGNVFLVSDGDQELRTKVLDFGIAKLPGDKAATSSEFLGTPSYMSPEQCRSTANVDHRSDIYSLGCLLYRMVTGRPPFLGTGACELIGQQIYKEPDSPRALAKNIPYALEAIIVRTLRKDPGERPQTMRELRDALVLAQGDAPLELAPTSQELFSAEITSVSSTVEIFDAPLPLSMRPARPRRSKRWPLGTVMMTALLLGFFALRALAGTPAMGAQRADASPSIGFER